MPTAKGMAAFVDNDKCRHGLVYDVSSVESDTGYASTGNSIHDEVDVQTIETLSDETKNKCSIINEKGARIVGVNKKAKF